MEYKETKPVFIKERKIEFLKNLIIRKTVGKVQTCLLHNVTIIDSVKEPNPNELLDFVKSIMDSTEKNNTIRELEIQDYKDA